MVRLTTTGFPECECESCYRECDDAFRGTCLVRKVIDRLAAYEDTGLSPEEVAAMKRAQEGEATCPQSKP